MSERYSTGTVLVFGFLFLFFFQLLSDFVSGIYTFGVLGTGLPIEMVYLLLFFSPLLLWLLRDNVSRTALIIIGELFILSHLIAPWLPINVRLLLSGIGVAAFLLLLPGLLWFYSRRRHNSGAIQLAAALTIGIALSIFLRSLHSGTDLSTVGDYRFAAMLAAGIVGLLLPRYALPAKEAETNWRKDDFAPTSLPLSRGRIIFLCIGAMLIILLFYFSLISPTTVARWTEDLNYPAVIAIVLLSLTIFVWLFVLKPSFFGQVNRKILIALTGGYFLILLLFLFLNRPPVVGESSVLPILAPPSTAISLVLIILILGIFPILLLDFARFLEAMIEARPSTSDLAIGFSLSSLVWLILIVANVANRAGGYLPGIGPPFKQRLWLTYLIAGLISLVALYFIDASARDDEVFLSSRKTRITIAGLTTLLAISSFIAVYVTASDPSNIDPRPLKIAAWNVMQGYDTEGHPVVEQQLEKLQETEADLILLSETDTAHVGGGNSDLIRYLADGSDMYSYYGPSPVAGTFGYALLSRYPIQEAGYHLLYSQEEHVAVIESQVEVNGQIYHLFVVHHDHRPENYEIQQRQLLALIEKRMRETEELNHRFVVAGDFNFPGNREDHPDDLALWQQTLALLDLAPLDACSDCVATNMVDHILVSSNVTVLSSGAIQGFEPQHPIVWATVE